MLYKVTNEWSVIEPVVVSMGYELVGVERQKQGRHETLRIYIDQPGGITVDDCAQVSHQVSGVLDVEDLIPGEYDLEVSSPGLDRPLFKLEDFKRFAGEEAKIRLLAAVDGRRNFKGTIIAAQDDMVLVEVDQQRYELPFGQIERARLVAKI